MYVLMDMEWYASAGENMPVQIAALRTDDRFQCLGQFARRIRPDLNLEIPRRRICFGDAEPRQYRAPAGLSRVMNDLKDWLRGDDVILWWHESSETLFRRIHERVFGCPPAGMGVLRTAVSAHLKDGKLKKGSARALAKARGIPAPEPEHDSRSGVQALFRLLKQIGLPIARYMEEGCMRETEPQPITAPKKDGGPEDGRGEYCALPGSGTAHRRGCPKIRSARSLWYYDNAESCVRSRLSPCDCCREEMDAYMLSVRRSYPVYVNARTGMAHLEGCVYAGRIAEGHGSGFFDLRAALSAGGRLCSRCAGLEGWYRRERTEAEDFCARNRLKSVFRDGALHVLSRGEAWRIVMDPARNEPTLYHRNAARDRKKADDGSLKDFHVQKCAWESIMEYLRYIKEHEKVASRRERKTAADERRSRDSWGKKARKDALRRRRVMQTAHVLDLLEELEECGV